MGDHLVHGTRTVRQAVNSLRSSPDAKKSAHVMIDDIEDAVTKGINLNEWFVKIGVDDKLLTLFEGAAERHSPSSFDPARVAE